MKLRSLQNSIHSSLTIIDHRTNEKYKNVECHDEVFESLKDRVVIGIRAKADTILVSIK